LNFVIEVINIRASRIVTLLCLSFCATLQQNENVTTFDPIQETLKCNQWLTIDHDCIYAPPLPPLQ
ncbi:14800_t:CDS:2, partial [Gigaspora rosea]